MDLRAELVRRSKDTRFIIAGLAAVLMICILFFFFLQRGRELPQPVLANRVVLFILWYVNVILILTIVYVLVRTLLRILVDRHNRILGSKFKTKLVLTSIALSLIPVLILFPFATRLVVDSFEQWFELPIEEVVRQASDMAQALSQQIETTNLRDAKRVLDSTLEYDLRDLDQRPALQQQLQTSLDELDLDYLALFDGTELIHGTASALSGISRDLTFRGLDRFLEMAINEGEAVKVESLQTGKGRLILAARAAAHGPVESDGTAAGHTVVLTATVLPPDLAATSEDLIRAYQNYLQLETHREELRTLYLQILLMVALLVILAFSSIGMRLARRFTVPIQALADGTKHISSGDLDHRVDVSVDDELGVLVNAFNHMTEELQRNKELVDRSNRELRDANEQLAAVLQNVAAGVIWISAEGRIQTCNGAACNILMQRAEDVIGKDIRQTWEDPERGKLVRLLNQTDSAQYQILPQTDQMPSRIQGFSGQLRLTIGGVWKTLEVKITELIDASGNGRGRVLFLEDLTELIQAQKMATWNEVARRIAHEIKNPLTPIKLTAERLLHKHRQNAPNLGSLLEDGVEIISREVSTLKNMVDEFSRFARMPRPRPREIDLEALVEETTGLYQDVKPGVEVSGHVDPRAATIRFDPDQLKSVLINLIDNALVATEAPGRVRIETQPNGSSVLLKVRDTGTGIRPEDREKLFLPYFSTKGRGTGLGLSIVHRIVNDHYAHIRVEDNRPKGTVFTLEVPLH